MATTLVIEVECENDSDLDWLRDRCVNAVNDVVHEHQEEGRLDGAVHTDWDIKDPEDEAS